MLQFKEWFLVESTISQLLKSNPDQINIGKISTDVEDVLDKMGWAARIPKERLAPLVKLFTFWIVTMQAGQKKDNHTQPWTPNLTYNIVSRSFVHANADFLAMVLVDQPNVARSKFNNPQYMLTDLNKDTADWHTRLAAKKRASADPGRKVEIANMPAGYYWVSLDRASCDQEGEAMGHCGNSGYTEGDNVWSMRDPKGVPHLTFIVNDQILGESKGFSNNKPEAKYHPHIIALLLGKENGVDIIQYVKGGGYKPEANFHIDDLSKDQKQQLLTLKPQLDDYFEFMKQKAGGDEAKWKELIDDAVNFKFTRIDVNQQQAIIKEFQDMNDLITWLKEETQSKLEEIPDFEDMPNWDFNTNIRDGLETFKHSADKEAEELMNQIIVALEAGSEDEEDEEDHDIEWAAEQNDEVHTALIIAAEDGMRTGAESDAYDHVLKYLKDQEDYEEHGFFIRATYGGGYMIVIGLKDLEKLYKSNDDWHGGYHSFTDFIIYKYDAPYNGYSGFDDHSYNERLVELLNDALANIKGDK